MQTTNEYESLRIENQLCFPLYACAKEVTRQYRKSLEELNLTYTQYIVMMVLWEYGEMTESELGRIVHLDSGTLAPLLKRLDKQGYINRIRPDDNERKLYLSLTEEGEVLKERAVEIPDKMQGCIDLPPDELMQLKILLDKALTKMGRTREGSNTE
ncbi:MAG: MarR family transcriptional regulator [Lachnospiraceae bacterium]|nr:MarR family transcriptional regulator [Lachnospiraceae bacterium]